MSCTDLRWLLLAGVLIGCDDAQVQVGVVDGTVAEAGADAILGDTGSTDRGPADAGPVDALPIDATPDVGIPRCVVDPPDEATFLPGENEGGPRLTVGGRRLTPAGPNTVVPGFPASVVVHPARGVAYVISASNDDRRVLVMDLETHEVRQDVDRDEAFFGLVLSPDGERLFASAGVAGRVDVFEVLEDGTLMAVDVVDTGGYPAGLAIAPDGARLWVGLFDEAEVLEVDPATLEVTERYPVAADVWDVLHVPARSELYVSTLQGGVITVLDLENGGAPAEIAVPTSPAGMVASPDGTRVYVAVSASDAVAAIDTAARVIDALTPVAGPDLVDPEGKPLPNSNVNALALDPASGRLYASRGADNAVTVFDAASLEPLGALPTSWYPTDLALVPGAATLVVTEGKGGGAGPNLGRSAKNQMKGSVTFVDLAALDLPAATAAVEANYRHPQTAFPFECESRFPIPTEPGQRSPIEHVVLILRENKTFDCVFGDWDDPRIDVDPELLQYGEEITPNTHALARTFSVSNNFFTEVQNSDTGHLLIVNSHLTEFVERIWVEKTRTGKFQGYQVSAPATPRAGNLYTHLMDHGVELRTFGQIVGMFVSAADGRRPAMFSDQTYPGGPFYNTGVADERKARHVIAEIESGRLAQFTFLLLPNDHTEGTRPGGWTPESMVADNDFAVGLVVEALANSPFWGRTAIFILQDDSQGCADHVDAHRSVLLVAGPYARRGHVSQAHASMMSVTATILRILGVPPMGRADASAAPLWDMFTDAPDRTKYVAIPRRIPEAFNPREGPGSEKSARMDFRGPDRERELGVVLEAHRAWKQGRITRAEAERRIADPALSDEEWADLDEEAEEETTAFDRDWERYQAWRKEKGLPPADPPYPAWQRRR